MYLYLYLHIATKESNLKESPPAAKSFPCYRKLLYFETCELFQEYSRGAHITILCMVASSITKVRASLYVEKSQDSR